MTLAEIKHMVNNSMTEPLPGRTPVIYIAGKVTGLPYEKAYDKFARRTAELRAMGYEVINPMAIVPREATWQEAMKICIAKLICADQIDMLPDWTTSTGAILEYRLAWRLGIPVFKS